MTPMETIQEFILTLNADPIWHSCWLGLKEQDGKPYLDPKTDRYEPEIKIAIRPRFKHKFNIPSEYNGLTVCQVPWPKGS